MPVGVEVEVDGVVGGVEEVGAATTGEGSHLEGQMKIPTTGRRIHG